MYPLQCVPQEGRMSAMGSPELLVVPEHASASAATPGLDFQPALCRIALVGFGTVGSAVARLLQARRTEHRLQLTHVCNRDIARKRVDWIARDVVWTESIEHVLASHSDVVVELMGGLRPAYDLVRRALESGKSVVTANKQLIAHCGAELQQLAKDNGQYLGFGACVAGGVPVLSGLQDGLAGDRIVQIRGILNGTCNYILSRIEKAGISFADALSEAQQAGFAEADPSFDIDGQDAGAKLAILARVGLKVGVSPERVLCRTIRYLSAIDFEYAHELRCTIRQISTGVQRDGDVYLAVQPSLVSNDSPLAKVSGSQNLIVSTGQFGGETMFGGYGAGGDPTAVAVLSDLFQAAGYQSDRPAAADLPQVAEREPKLDIASPHYVRFVVRDRVGIIALLAGAFARHGLNLDAILQKPGFNKSALPFVVTIEPCGQKQLDDALQEIGGLDFLVEAPVSMPIVS
jgi:homoserine dehydrogenase